MSSTIEQGSQTVGHTDNSVFIDADIDHVWHMTNDLPTWPDLFTENSEVEGLEQSGSTFRFRLTRRPDENGRVWSWVSERTLDEAAREVVARRVGAPPVEVMGTPGAYPKGGARTP